MTETQRFLRYVTPGLTFGVVALVLLLIMLPQWTFRQLTSILDSDAAVVAVLGTLVASGGVGYLFSVIHHAWHWCSWVSDIDHSQVIQRLVEAKRITFINAATRQPLTKPPTIDRMSAWIILTTLWHERLKKGTPLEVANPRACSLADLAHSAGTGRVASIAAYLAVLAFAVLLCPFSREVDDVFRFIATNLVAILIIYTQQRNYRRLCKMAQGYFEQAFCDCLETTAAEVNTFDAD